MNNESNISEQDEDALLQALLSDDDEGLIPEPEKYTQPSSDEKSPENEFNSDELEAFEPSQPESGKQPGLNTPEEPQPIRQDPKSTQIPPNQMAGNRVFEDQPNIHTPTELEPAQIERILHQLEHQVTCEIGQINLTQTEANNLTVGSILNLNKSIRTPVTVTKHGKKLAEADIVEIEGNIGIKITKILD